VIKRAVAHHEESGAMLTEVAAHPLVLSRSPPDVRLRRMVDDHFDGVWRSLKRLGVPEADVDDAVQQVFLVASRKLDRIETGRERCYLLGVALRVASDARATLHRRSEMLSKAALEKAPPQDPGPEATLDDKRARAVLADILESMPAEMREAFVMFELEEFTAVEVAEVLRVPVGTVASRVRRARDHVRERLAARASGEEP
jgi:RNA polymerase sigma-70 factor (ECF subfamily)